MRSEVDTCSTSRLRVVLVGKLDIVVGSVGCYTTHFLAVAYRKLVGLELSLCGSIGRIGDHAWGGGERDEEPGCEEAAADELKYSKVN